MQNGSTLTVPDDPATLAGPTEDPIRVAIRLLLAEDEAAFAHLESLTPEDAAMFRRFCVSVAKSAPK